MMNKRIFLSLPALALGLATGNLNAATSYVIVDSGQVRCYDNRDEIAPPKPGQPFYGQDAQFKGHPAKYSISADGLTVADEVTGLTWQRGPETDGDGALTMKDKLTWEQAKTQPAKLNAAKFGGFSDWRLPTIKELYSLFDCRGTDPSGFQGSDTSGLVPFIDTKFFNFVYGDVSAGMRIIDAQYASCTKYVGKSARGFDKVFGVNFPDGRIKGYDLQMPGGGREFKFFVLCCRGNPAYGKNDYRDNKDGTISDRATGLEWTKADSGRGMNWEAALSWAQQKNAEKFLGHDDWRLPNVKELQSIVDYSRAPDVTHSPAIDPVFECTAFKNEIGETDYGFYWSATTHGGFIGNAEADYIAFGRASGWMSPRGPMGGGPGRMGGPGAEPQPAGAGEYKFVDVHGAGAQRCAPKAGDAREFPHGHGPQGDVVRIENFVRLVRGGDVAKRVAPAIPTMAPGAAAAAPSRMMGPPLATALDLNGDGVIDADEIAKASESLKALDRNGDGKITSDEYRMQGPPGGAGGFGGPPRGGGPGGPGF